MKTTLVVLEVTTEDDRQWWETMKLPEPARWLDAFPDAFVRDVIEREVAR